GRGRSARQYIRAVESLQSHSRRIASWWEAGFDLLLTPTLAEPPPPLGEFSAKPGDPLRGFRRALPFVTFTSPFNISGQPAISLPLCWNGDGLPIGVQLAAAYEREDLLIRVATQLEEARPWAGRRPAVHAGSVTRSGLCRQAPRIELTGMTRANRPSSRRIDPSTTSPPRWGSARRLGAARRLADPHARRR